MIFLFSVFLNFKRNVGEGRGVRGGGKGYGGINSDGKILNKKNINNKIT